MDINFAVKQVMQQVEIQAKVLDDKEKLKLYKILYDKIDSLCLDQIDILGEDEDDEDSDENSDEDEQDEFNEQDAKDAYEGD